MGIPSNPFKWRMRKLAVLLAAAAVTAIGGGVVTATSANAADGNVVATRSLASLGASKAEYTMYSAPFSDSYVVGHTTSGTDEWELFECGWGWWHIRTVHGRGGDHYNNTVAWIFTNSNC